MLQAEVESSRHSLLEHLRDLVASYASQQPVRQVAVVGNAPMSADAERARLIDSSDLVFRINAMALDTPSGPPNVGSRCHVVILSRYARITPWTFEDYRRRLTEEEQEQVDAGIAQLHALKSAERNLFFGFGGTD